ncbi:MAG: uncharacterized protein V7607_2102 [Solirubrobacteraceae bacterium]
MTSSLITAVDLGHAPDDVEILRNCLIPLPGGDELAADVYLPAAAQPAPALVTLLPYHKDGLAGVDGWRATSHFVRSGYACVLVDFRGTGSSGGLARPPFDDGEADDGVAAVAWAADQPWCDGAVGMWGASYGAMTALRTAARGAPALKAIISVVGHSDHAAHFVRPGGVRASFSPLGAWGLTTLSLQLTPPLHHDRDGRWLNVWRRRLDTAVPYVVDLARRAPDPEGAWAVDVPAIDVPTFCVGGWRDLNCEGTLAAYGALRAPKRLLMGPWMHTLPDESPFEPVDFLAMATRWWDRWLRGDENGVEAEPPVTIFVQGGGGWRRLPDWPPPASTVTTWTATAGQGLAADGASSGDDLALLVDSTVGTGGGLWSVPTRGFGLPHDQHDDDVRSLAFTSAPLDGALEIIGQPRVRATLRGEGGRVVVLKLARVERNGCSTLLTTGTLALPGDGEHEVDVLLHGTSVQLLPGERLRLTLAGADFPRLWPDAWPGTLIVCAGRLAVELPSARAAERIPPPSAPAAVTNPLLLRAEPTYTVTRDRIGDGIALTLQELLLTRTADGAGVVELRQRLVAEVARERPDAARIEGHATTTVTGPQGMIVVEAGLQLRRDATRAQGEVSWDGAPMFSRRWEA